VIYVGLSGKICRVWVGTYLQSGTKSAQIIPSCGNVPLLVSVKSSPAESFDVSFYFRKQTSRPADAGTMHVGTLIIISREFPDSNKKVIYVVKTTIYTNSNPLH
jgi:hypothetical protein